MMGIVNSNHAARAIPRARLAMALLVVLSGSAAAIDLDYEVGVAAKHSDNINLSDANPASDTVLSPRLYFKAEQVGRTVQLAGQGDLEYLHYASNTFNDTLRGQFAGSLNWTILPERVNFVVQDYLSLQPVDELVASNPDNQQQVNIFVAGPTMHARFSGTTRGQLDLRYINSYAEERASFDSDRFSAAARLVRALSANSSVSAHVEASDVSFDSSTASDYRRYDGYLNSTTTRQDIDLSLDLGYSRVNLDNVALGASDRESSPLARATLNWRITPRSSVDTTLRYQLNDAAQSLMTPREFDRRAFNDFRSADVLVEPNIYRERLARVRYVYNDDRLRVQAAPYYRRIRYVEPLSENHDRRGALVSADLRLRPRLTLSGYVARENREFVDISRRDRDLVARIGLANRFTRHWTGRVDVQRRERDSTAPGRSYDENAVMVSFSYQR